VLLPRCILVTEAVRVVVEVKEERKMVVVGVGEEKKMRGDQKMHIGALRGKRRRQKRGREGGRGRSRKRQQNGGV